MSIKAMTLAAAAAITLAAPAAAFAHDYQGYSRGAYDQSYGYRHDDGYGYQRGYEHEMRSRWSGRDRSRERDGWRRDSWGRDGWRAEAWRYGDHRAYDRRD